MEHVARSAHGPLHICLAATSPVLKPEPALLILPTRRRHDAAVIQWGGDTRPVARRTASLDSLRVAGGRNASSNQSPRRGACPPPRSVTAGFAAGAHGADS